MCYNCGCGIPQDSMGHDENITEKTLDELGKKLGKDSHEIKHYLLSALQAYFEKGEDKIKEDKDLEDLFEKASKAWGQDIEEAKKETYKLLKKNHNH